MIEEIAARGERTRIEILQSAHQLFLSRGYHGTSMRQIASEAGVALGSIYNHFSSKEEIFTAVLIDYHPLFKVLPAMGEIPSESFEAFIRDAARQMVDGIKRLRRAFKFKDFREAMQFTNRVGELAEQEDHHPAILTEWGKVTVTWWTHKIKGLHRNDFIMAAKTDSL